MVIFLVFFGILNYSKIDEYNSGDDNQQQEKDKASDIQKSEPKRNAGMKAEALQKKEEDSGDEDGKKQLKIEGLYNPADYTNLNVSTEITELFKYITR